MSDLQALPGIGSGLAAELRAVGIPDAETLRTVGAGEAATRLAELGMRDASRTARVLVEALGESTAAPVPVLGIGTVTFTVGDLDTALAHYASALGLPVAHRASDPPTALLALGPGAAGLLLREDRSMAEASASGRAPQLGLEVADVDAAALALRSAGLVVGEPIEGPGGRTVQIADPWGNVVGLASATSHGRLASGA